MAITEQEYLHIQYGNRIYMLLRSPTHFHMVQVNVSLTEEAMAQLMQLYPCSTKELEALRLHVSAFKATTLKEVQLEGRSLELHRSSDVLHCTLETDYPEYLLRNFFAGYPLSVTHPPEPKTSRTTIGKLNRIMHIASTASALLLLCLHSTSILWSIPALLCQLPPLLLLLLAPEYFYFTDVEKDKYNPSLRDGNVFWPMFCPMIAVTWTSLTHIAYEESVFFRLLLIHTLLSLLLFALAMLHKPFRSRCRGKLLFLAVILLFSFGNTNVLNYFAAPIPVEGFTATVTELQLTRYSRGKSYEAIVSLPNGSDLELNLRKDDYRALSRGDSIRLNYHEGALGLCPLYVYELPHE